MIDILEELQTKNTQLDQALKTLRKNGIELAEAERAYKEAVTKEVLRLRDEGMPVTIIKDVIYGTPSISALRFERDCKEAIYDANQNALQVKKLQLRLIEAELQREWGNTQ